MKKATCYLNRMQSDPPLEESLFAHRTLLDGDEDTRSLTFAYLAQSLDPTDSSASAATGFSIFANGD